MYETEIPQSSKTGLFWLGMIALAVFTFFGPLIFAWLILNFGLPVNPALFWFCIAWALCGLLWGTFIGLRSLGGCDDFARF